MGIRQSTQESGDLGVLESQVGGAAQFGRRSDMRFAARKAFARGLQPQISRRCTQEGSTHPHKLSSWRYRRVHRLDREAGKDPTSSAARIIGFEDKTAWLIHQGIPIAAALSRLRPCTTAELLAHQVLTRGHLQYDPVDGEGGQQQRFVDFRGEDDEMLGGAETPRPRAAASAAPETPIPRRRQRSRSGRRPPIEDRGISDLMPPPPPCEESRAGTRRNSW